MKYHNKKVEYKQIKFDSIKERQYYIVLKDWEKKGIIKDLQRQVKFELQPSYVINGNKVRAITYKADFTYIKDNELHVVDVKGYRTEVYKIKKKLFEYKYGIELEEV